MDGVKILPLIKGCKNQIYTSHATAFVSIPIKYKILISSLVFWKKWQALFIPSFSLHKCFMQFLNNVFYINDKKRISLFVSHESKKVRTVCFEMSLRSVMTIWIIIVLVTWLKHKSISLCLPRHWSENGRNSVLMHSS